MGTYAMLQAEYDTWRKDHLEFRGDFQVWLVDRIEKLESKIESLTTENEELKSKIPSKPKRGRPKKNA